MPSKLDDTQLKTDPQPTVERITLVTTVARRSRRDDVFAGLFFASAILMGLWVLAVGATSGAEAPLFRAFERL
ncbi:MAG: hypothetical protein ACLGIN_03040 [Candidatus Sericytochromatia bacterium]